jgi:sulfite exporter TauE/SafE
MECNMGIGTSIFLIAVGAILDFAVDVQTQGFNLHTIGVILMVVGAIGVVLSLIFWSSWGGFHTSRETVVETGPRGGYRDPII